MAKKIYIDAGHGGSDPGAIGHGRRESDDVLKLSKKVKVLLQVQGVTVVMTREVDVKKTIAERTALANNSGADYFASIHRNSFSSASAKGAEVWVYSKATAETVKKAQRIQDELVRVGFANRGVKKGAPSYNDFGVNRDTKMPACLVEVGFISNINDNKIFDSKFEALAKGVAKALCVNVGVTYKEPSSGAATSLDPHYPVPGRPINEIALKVIRGDFGNGAERKEKLENAGYNYTEVQAEVNRILKGETKPTEPTKPVEPEKSVEPEEVKPDPILNPEEPVEETPKEALESLFVKLFALISKLFGK